MTFTLPVAVVGAGPIGLAAAAHLVAAGETPIVFEAGPRVGASIRQWSHVRLFSPWVYNLDKVAAAMLAESGWRAPDPNAFPTGGELVDRYLAPLAALPQLAPHIRVQTRVRAITRQGMDKMKTVGREHAPFELWVQRADGSEERVLARAVIDASGTYQSPNPLGANGVPAVGEAALTERIFYGIPNISGAQRDRYAGRRVLVAGSGHSAFNVITDLAALAESEPGTEIVWAVRRASIERVFGGGENDALPARGELGLRVRHLLDRGVITLATNFRAAAARATAKGIIVMDNDRALPPVDEIIVAAGFRPDLQFLHEIRLDLDTGVESPRALAPLIDPNVHSCGTVRPHGAIELAHPEPNFYIVGMKSYGRAPNFLMLTGYEQVRSVVAALTGDWEAARNVELALPATGVCFTDFNRSNGAAEAGCGVTPTNCGTTEPVGTLPVITVTSARGGCCS